jgi:hypothetical protein
MTSWLLIGHLPSTAQRIPSLVNAVLGVPNQLAAGDPPATVV